MIVTTDAIVLRARKQGETSKIVTLYTLGFGKLNVIAKGAREMKSKFGGALEMFARTSAVFYKKERSEPGLYLLSKADIIESHSGILQSLDRIGPAMAIVEILLRSMHDEEAHPSVFHLVAETFHALSTAANDTSAAPLEFRFYIEFARLMGFEVSHAARSEAPRGAAEKLALLHRATIEEASQLILDERVQQQLRGFFHGYFANHLPGVTGRSMKSGSVFGKLGMKS